MVEKIDFSALPLSEKSKYFIEQPWLIWQRPFKIIENIYYVGNQWVSAYLIDTPDGLAMIDCTYGSNFYQVVDSIYRLGFHPQDVKLLLLTHGHFDHCGAAAALQAMSGCEIWLGEGDSCFFTTRQDLCGPPGCCVKLNIDHFYDYSRPIEFGGMRFQPLHAPGHTQGMTSIMFHVPHKGESLCCCVDGGFGTNGLSQKELLAAKLPLSLQQDFVHTMVTMREYPVDVVLPSHAAHAVGHSIFEIADHDDGSGSGFIDPNVWYRMLTAKLNKMLEIIEKDQQNAP